MSDEAALTRGSDPEPPLDRFRSPLRPPGPLPLPHPPLDEILAPLVAAERWAVGQLGQSLDGRIATASGHSHYVTGPEDLDRLHALRALADAVVVGTGTVRADNPRLTVRRGPWVDRPGLDPVRVVLDPGGGLDPDHHLFLHGEAPTLWVVAEDVAEDPSLPDHVERWRLPLDGFEPRTLLRRLAARGLERILVEGGGVTVSRFLAGRALDRLHVVVAPLLIGSGRPGITLPEIRTLDEALRPPCRTFGLGSDVLFDLILTSASQDVAAGGGGQPEGS